MRVALGLKLITVSRQSAHDNKPDGRQQLLSVRPTVTFSAAEHYRPLASTKLYCSVTEARVYEQLVQSHYMKAKQPGVKLATFLFASPTPQPSHHNTTHIGDRT